MNVQEQPRTNYFYLNPVGNNIPVYIKDGVQITTILSGNEYVEVQLSVPEKDEPEVYHEPMKRFRVYDKWLHETLEQSDTTDYSYRDKENMWICDITDALEDPSRFVVQENTGIKDMFGRYIFEGDIVSFNEIIFSKTTVLKGTVTRSESGTWVIMHDKDIPFCLYDSKPRMILGHINEGV